PISPEATYLGKIVQALLDLKHARPSSLEPSRNLVELVLRRLHRLSDQESAEVTAASVASILHQLEGLDERFLEETRRRVETLKRPWRRSSTRISPAPKPQPHDGHGTSDRIP